MKQIEFILKDGNLLHKSALDLSESIGLEYIILRQKENKNYEILSIKKVLYLEDIQAFRLRELPKIYTRYYMILNYNINFINEIFLNNELQDN